MIKQVEIIGEKSSVLNLCRHLIPSFLAIFILVGCSGQEKLSLDLENRELKARVNELEMIIEGQNDQIEQYKKEYELRNLLDIEARRFLSAINSGVVDEITGDLLGENVIVEDEKLIITFEGKTFDLPFFKNKLDFERVRQRFYHLDEQGRFVTGYEICSLPDEGEERATGVLNFTFIKGSGRFAWELIGIETDR